MHYLALEIIQTLDIWIARLIQLADSRDEEIAFDAIRRIELCLFAASDLNIDGPAVLAVVPCSSRHRRVEAYVLVEIVFASDIAEIILYDWGLVVYGTNRETRRTRISSCPGYSRVQSGFCSKEYEYSILQTSQQQPGYLLSYHVPPTLDDFSTMMKLWH